MVSGVWHLVQFGLSIWLNLKRFPFSSVWPILSLATAVSTALCLKDAHVQCPMVGLIEAMCRSCSSLSRSYFVCQALFLAFFTILLTSSFPSGQWVSSTRLWACLARRSAHSLPVRPVCAATHCRVM